MRARRPEDPRHFVLVEEIYVRANQQEMKRGHHLPPKVERRMLSDDEAVYQAQYQWKDNAGKFILMEHSKAALQVGSAIFLPEHRSMYGMCGNDAQVFPCSTD